MAAVREILKEQPVGCGGRKKEAESRPKRLSQARTPPGSDDAIAVVTDRAYKYLFLSLFLVYPLCSKTAFSAMVRS